GATASALMMSCLRQWGFQDPAYLVPDRFRFGYGLSAELVAAAEAQQPDLLVTVDNGISSVAGVAAAAERGIDVIVTDHHLPGEVLPDAAVIVNPNAPGDSFASKALAGVGVAFYVMAATGQRLAADGVTDAAAARTVVADCLDLVAVGTVADLVPLDHNNRILVTQGLARIRAGLARPGINALFAAAGRDTLTAVPADIGFGVAPRLNASGRLDDISIGIECLLGDHAAATRHSAALSQLNETRKQMQAEMQTGAEVHLEQQLAELQGELPAGLCLFDPTWHQGVVGLVATRIKDQVNRPVVAFAAGEGEGLLKGSGRSVRGVHLRDLLAEVDARHPGLIERFGGHAMAAGLTLHETQLEQFRESFAAVATAQLGNIADDQVVMSDGLLAADELGLPLAEQLRVAAPWGQSFPEPVFDGLFRLLNQKLVGGHHLKLRLSPADGSMAIDAIAFNHPDLLPAESGAECRVAYRLDVNEYRGSRSPQLVVEYIECV
ncbi:MAG: single-stranded-DNA-specific exonuclease RecJ, partial [Gammaproteobacteria bacterium]|nr:single-stranded-DNA-specific exonuclease RecJ [Gammaproteobacteria bacterium]